MEKLEFEYPESLRTVLSDLEEIVKGGCKHVTEVPDAGGTSEEKTQNVEQKAREMVVESTLSLATTEVVDSDDDDFPEYEIPEIELEV